MLCASCSTTSQPEVQLVPQTEAVTVLPPKQTDCPPLPTANNFVTTGDLLADREAVRKLYGPCALKVHTTNVWRKQHGGG